LDSSKARAFHILGDLNGAIAERQPNRPQWCLWRSAEARALVLIVFVLLSALAKFATTRTRFHPRREERHEALIGLLPTRPSPHRPASGSFDGSAFRRHLSFLAAKNVGMDWDAVKTPGGSRPPRRVQRCGGLSSASLGPKARASQHASTCSVDFPITEKSVRRSERNNSWPWASQAASSRCSRSLSAMWDCSVSINMPSKFSALAVS
jgi:hypothetical protein